MFRKVGLTVLPLLVVTGTGTSEGSSWASGREASAIAEASGICGVGDTPGTTAESSGSNEDGGFRLVPFDCTTSQSGTGW